MAKKLSGKSHCEQHGEFAWSGYSLDKGEVITGKWKDLSSNFVRAVQEKDRYIVQTKCPICSAVIKVSL